MEFRIDHVQIAAPPGCERAARTFFGELLGMAEIAKPEPLRARGGVWFRVDDRELHVGVEPDFVAAQKAHVALRVGTAELDGLAERLGVAGFPVAWDDELPRERRFYSEDPWGNRVEFIAAD